MADLSQRTIRSPVGCIGIGLHSGARVQMTLRPASAGSGIVFTRVDLKPAVDIPARAEYVVDTRFATTLGLGEVRVGTVEHLLSALNGLGIDNLRIEVDGPEIPIMDGSAGPFVYLLRTAGVELQRKLKRFLVVRKAIEVREGDKLARIAPAPQFGISCTIDFDHPLIKDQDLRVVLSDRVYYREIARARTFTLLRDVEGLKRVGLARGGSLENAIVVDDFNILNPEGLRFADEFVRHKVLDIMGDLALCGLPVIGHFTSHKSGHTLNQKLVRQLAVPSDSVEVVEVREKRQLEKLALESPAFGLNPIES
ncbi:MAG TPA: UDP-3-O-acyl-N-acetylglucosamine deacetylase [Anaeromyxobacteraceae bacterium]|nr:UDP-3-O-acyl-N-acetylglucosamine deacetylase [Anaeromyxobacteraceae bacterium]